MSYFKPNTKQAIKLAVAIKGITAALTGMAYVTNKANMMFAVMVVGALATEAINFFSDDTKKPGE